MSKQWNLIRLRDEFNISRQQMAKILNVDLSTYVNKELGRTQFKSDEMFIIRSIFNIPIEQIFLPSNSIINAIKDKEVHLKCKN